MPSRMKNINAKIIRSGSAMTARSFCDESMITFKARDKGGTELIKIKILCEVFEDVYAYEVFVADKPYIRYTYNKITKEYDF